MTYSFSMKLTTSRPLTPDEQEQFLAEVSEGALSLLWSGVEGFWHSLAPHCQIDHVRLTLSPEGLTTPA